MKANSRKNSPRSNHPRICSTDSAREGGFSLVELLILFLIVSVLLAVLAPVFSALNEEQNRAQCRDNLRVQLAAMHAFAEDHFGEPLGPDAPPGATAENTGFWHVLSSSTDNAPLDLYPSYVDDLNVFLCPSTANVIRPDEFNRRGELADLFFNAMYREDSFGGHSYEYLGVYGTREMAGIVKTPETTAGLEAVTYLVTDADDSGFQNCPDPTNNHWEDGANYGFVSGHVEWVPRAEINQVSYESFHSAERCPDLAVWVDGPGKVTVRVVGEAETTETQVTTHEGFALDSAQEVEIEAAPGSDAIFAEWGGSFSGSGDQLDVNDWTKPVIAVARFQAVNVPGSSLRIGNMEAEGEQILLTVENPAGVPYQVQRLIGSLEGEWETIATDQTAEIWTGTIPAGANRCFWRVVQ